MARTSAPPPNASRTLATRVKLALMLVLTSVMASLLALLAVEGLVRLTTDITLQGTSRELLTADAFGTSRGNTPGIEAISFGQRVYVDEHGFRVGPSHRNAHADRDDALLILGDSVGFGPGVEYDSTFAARLEAGQDTFKVYNASVMGYTTQGYLDVVRYVVPRHPETRRAFLVFCLNDISRESAAEIEAALADDRQGRRVAFVEALRRRGPVDALNTFLRSRSKLYLWLRAVLTRPQERFWYADRSRYEEENAQGFEASMRHLEELAGLLRERRIPLTVVIAPYEFQLRVDGAGDRIPQQRLLAALDRLGIDTIDALEAFERAGAGGSKLFLSYDAMHLSARGHAVLYELVREHLVPG